MLIEIENLIFKYPNQISNTLEIASLQIKKQEKVFLFGPSGSGKTTLLEILAGILPPTSGQVKILNQPLSQLHAAGRDKFRADHIGYIFQNFNLIPYLSVQENITLPLYMSAAKRKQIPHEKELQLTHEICAELGIEPFLNKTVTELSVGQQQRVAAARALLGAPELILADEPTSSLDFDHREKFVNLLFKLADQKNITVVFVSHDRSLQNLFDRAIDLHEINKASQSQTEVNS